MTVSFSQPKTAALSLDARHLLNRAQARRDRVLLSAGGFGLSALAGFKAATIGFGVAPIMSASILMALAAGVGIQSLRSARRVDQEMSKAVANFSEPVANYKLFMSMNDLQKVVEEADRVAPGLVSALAQRRQRAWKNT